MKRTAPTNDSEGVPSKLKYRVHRVRFFQPETKAVNVLAYEKSTKKLAVVRSDFSIEIWNLKFTPCVEGVILGDPNNSIEAAVWHSKRLFTAGLNGHITEYNLAKLQPKYSVAVTSGPAWCLAENHQQTHIAAGTEQGYVCIFEIAEDGLNFFKTLNKQEGRILCLAWHKDGDIIVTGSSDLIRIWNVKSGHVIDRISVGRMQKNRETLVWCLTVTSDFTIISGDSCGRTSFWDGATATLISSSRVHNADVLTLCLSGDEKSVYVAGVDPLVVEFTRIGQSQKWVKSLQRTNHTHDVRALACAKDWIVSGGMDTYLAISSRTSLTKHLSFERSAVQLASASGHLVLNGESHLELWQLGSSGSQEGAPGEALPLSTRPALLAHVRPRQGTRFHCAAVSPNCQWLAGSTADRVLLYRVNLEGDGRAPSFEKVAPLMDELGPARFLLFTEDCSRLLVFSVHGAVQVFQLGMPPTLLHTIPATPDATTHVYMACLCSGKFFATADNESNVVVYSLQSYEVVCRLPQRSSLPTAMRFAPKSCDLVVVFSDNQVIEFDVEQGAYTHWCQQMHSAGSLTLKTRSPLTGLTFDPKNQGVFFLYNDHELFLIDKKKVLTKAKVGSQSLRRSLEFKWLAMFDSLEDDMVAVEVPPSQLLKHLPPPLWQKKYGT